jgi:hypothetical protein
LTTSTVQQETSSNKFSFTEQLLQHFSLFLCTVFFALVGWPGEFYDLLRGPATHQPTYEHGWPLVAVRRHSVFATPSATANKISSESFRGKAKFNTVDKDLPNWLPASKGSYYDPYRPTRFSGFGRELHLGFPSSDWNLAGNTSITSKVFTEFVGLD